MECLNFSFYKLISHLHFRKLTNIGFVSVTGSYVPKYLLVLYFQVSQNAEIYRNFFLAKQ